MNPNTTPPQTTEQRLTALGNKRYYRALALTVAWLILVMTAFAVYMIPFKRSFGDPRNYVLLILCVLPFFPFGAHRVLLSKTFYATVAYGVHANQFESLKWAGHANHRPDRVAVLELTFIREDGKKINVTYKKSTYPGKGFHYAEGDRVLFIRGLRFPYKLPAHDREGKFTCPVCGTTVECDSMVCRGCRLDYAGESQ